MTLGLLFSMSYSFLLLFFSSLTWSLPSSTKVLVFLPKNGSIEIAKILKQGRYPSVTVQGQCFDSPQQSLCFVGLKGTTQTWIWTGKPFLEAFSFFFVISLFLFFCSFSFSFSFLQTKAHHRRKGFSFLLNFSVSCFDVAGATRLRWRCDWAKR